MNTDAECTCCPPSTCVACMPQSSANPYVRIRAERPLKDEFVCSIKNCNIFGGHDTNPMTEYPCHKKRNEIKDENEKSLGSPVGLVASNVNFKTEAQAGDLVGTRYSAYLKAFARLHLNEEKTWDPLLIDDVVKEGLDLYASSQKRESDAEAKSPPSDIYMANEVDVSREFELSGFTFKVELMPQFKLDVSNSSEIGANGDGAEYTLHDFMPVVKSFFRQYKYGLLTVDSFYAMIWRSKDVYFVFDVCGRRVADFRTDIDKGVPMLMCFRSLQNVKHLIVNLSRLKSTTPLIIRELKLVKVVTPNGVIMQQYYGTRTQQYEIVNDDYAYLISELHLSLNRRDFLRNRSSLPVAVTAIAVSKIEHPATWDMKMVDKIICFGVNFCQSRWLNCRAPEAIDVNEFPTYFIMGQFHVNIEFWEHKYEGTWRCVPGFRHSELADNIKNAFDAGHSKLIMEINCQMYAIWKKHEFIYLFDPYRHRILGKPNESEVFEKMEKKATVRMFRSFEVFMNVFNHILLDSNRTSQFFLHIVKVKNIQSPQKVKQGKARPVEEPKLDDYGEVISINEHICFEEAADTCKAALAEISDYEDEDLKSDVIEIDLKTSSSEEELVDEEELFDEEEWEEMEGIESSSTDEEGAVHKKRGTRGKLQSRGGKGGVAKGKGGKKRSKKSKGANDSEDDGADDSKSRKGRKGQKTKHKKYKPGDDEDSKGSKKGGTKSKGKAKDDLKEGQGSRKDKGSKDFEKDQESFSKNKEESQDKDHSKDKDQSQHKDLSQDKDISQDKDLSRDKDFSRAKDLSKDKDASEERDKDKDLSKSLGEDEDLNREKNLSKHKVLSKDGEDLTKNQDEDPSTQTDRSKDKGISGEEDEISKDKSLHKDKDQEGPSQSAHKPDRGEAQDKDSNKENQLDNDFDDSDIEQTKRGGKSKQKGAGKISEKSDRCKDRKKVHNDGTEADDENEDCFKEKPHCSMPNPDRYPGYCKFPVDLAFVGSESGSYESICKLFQAGFRIADRLLLMTPWGNFVIFRCTGNGVSKHYFLFDGCTCNFDRFRHLDLSVGTAGLLCFEHTHNVIEYIRHLRKSHRNYRRELENTADDICKEYCNKTSNLRL